jgi:hypothetical protein
MPINGRMALLYELISSKGVDGGEGRPTQRYEKKLQTQKAIKKW